MTASPHADDDLTVEEMLAAADDLANHGLSAKLTAIRHTTGEGGVTVTVDLHGKLVGLTFDQHAMKLRAAELASRIRRLTDQAAAAALADGLATLAGACDGSLAAELAEQLGCAR